MKKILFVVLTIGLLLYGCGQYLNYKVNSAIINLAEKLSLQIGHEVKIASVSSRWDWLYLKINVSDLVILDKDSKVALFMAKNITSTVDAIESILHFKVRFKRILVQSPRLVLQLHDKQQDPKIMGVGGDNFPGNVDLKKILAILGEQPRITIENGDFHIQGKNNADLPFMNVKLDFTEKYKYQYNIIARGKIAAAVPPEFNFAMNYVGDLQDFAQALIDFELKTSNIQVKELLNFYPDLASLPLDGTFVDLDFIGTIQNGDLHKLRTEYLIDTLKIDKNFELLGGSGKINLNTSKDKINISLQNLKLRNAELFNNPIDVHSMRASLAANYNDNIWNITTDNLEMKVLDMQYSSKAKIEISNKQFRSFEVETNTHNSSITKALRLMPDKMMSNDLSQWLKKSLTAGTIDDLRFSYHPNKSYLFLKFKGVNLKYAQDWPSIDKINADFTLDGNNLFIDVQDALVMNNKINSIIAKYPIIDGSGDPIISISGNLGASLEQGLIFLQQTPLKDDLADKLQPFNPSGKIGLDLKLLINLKNGGVKTAVDGLLTLKQDSLKIPNLELALTDINGKISFNNMGLKSQAIDLKLLNKNAVAHVELDKHQNNLDINISTPLDIALVDKLFPEVNLPKITGITMINAALIIPWQAKNNEKTLTITSDLKGITCDYPEPFKKQANKKVPLKLNYVIGQQKSESLSINVGNILDANILINDAKLLGANVSLGASKAYQAKQGVIFVGGKVDTIDWGEWQGLFENKDKAFTLPLETDILISQLKFQDYSFNNTRLKFESTTNKMALENEIIKGSIRFAEKTDGEKFDIRLDRLNLATGDANNNQIIKYLRDRKRHGQLPLIQFYAEDLKLAKKSFRKVSMQLLPRLYGYEIAEFSAANDNILIQAQGQWQFENKSHTQMSGNAYSNDFGRSLLEWGYENSISKGNGEANFSLQWEGDPNNFEWKNVNGNTHVEIKSGVLTKVNPGIGRVIGLLSFESIQRRLQLDFSDVLGDGFSFDKLSADLKFNSGIASTENVTINAPSARIELVGKTNLRSQDLDFIMLVTTKVGAGIPVAAAIAIGNPAVGAAIWLFDKASGSKISEMARYRYKVSGTWKQPKITEIDVNKAQDDKR